MTYRALLLCALLAATPAFASESAHWSYGGEGGPDHWGDLDPAFAACKDGRMQSPIDLGAANERATVQVQVSYKPVPLTVLHNGHTVQFNVDNGSAITLAGISYKLLQVHFHTPSEHKDHGVSYPLEAHFVHKSDQGALAVIGVLFKPGAPSKALEPLLAHLPTTQTPPVTYDKASMHFEGLLPAKRQLVRYMGSLTTPPCSEGVNWMVMQDTMTASQAQIDQLAKAMGDNARPLQAPDHRLIVAPK